MSFSNKDEYLVAVQERLGNFSYNQRLQEELSDHFDDTLTSVSLQSQSSEEAMQQTIKKLGEPDQISNDYNKTMRTLFAPHLLRDIVLITAFSFVVMALGYAAWSMIIDTVRFDSDNQVAWQVMRIISIPVYALFVSAYYYVALQQVDTSAVTRPWRKWVIATILLVPLCIAIASIAALSADIFYAIQFDEYTIMEILTTGQFIGTIQCVGMFLAAWYVAYLYVGKPSNTQASIFGLFSLNIASHAVGGFLLLIVLSWIISMQWMNPYISEDPSIFQQLINALASTVFLVQFLIHALFMGIVTAIFPLVVVIWLLGIGMLLLAILGLWQIAQYVRSVMQKQTATFPWMGIVITTFALGGVLFSPNPNSYSSAATIDWQVPYIAISNEIEKKQLGPIYRMVKFVNQDEGKAFFYSIGLDDATGQLYINQNSGNRFYLSQINSVNNYNIRKVKRAFNENMNWSSGFVGINNSAVKCNILDTEDLPENYQEIPQSCKELYYKDTLLFTNTDFFPQVSSVEISSDEKWALIQFYNGSYDPHAVYLVQL